MTEEENKAIENFEKKLIIEKYTKNIGTPIYIKDIETILNLIQKLQEGNNNKDKQIDLMAKQLNKLICNIDFDKKLQEGEDYSECIVKYFEKQAKEV